MTLAAFAHRLWLSGGMGSVEMIHAVSPAVPPAATERVRMRAEREGWRLTVTGAGEFDDPRYRDNPVNRCYFCKTNLYDRIRTLTAGAIASGANLDDLGDYRPGLLAASERAIVHPYIEAGIERHRSARLPGDWAWPKSRKCQHSPASPAVWKPASQSILPIWHSLIWWKRGSPRRRRGGYGRALPGHPGRRSQLRPGRRPRTRGAG